MTPANTPTLGGQAQLYRHIVVELHHPLHLQQGLPEDAQGGGEASLVHINTAIAICLYFMTNVLVYALSAVYFSI